MKLTYRPGRHLWQKKEVSAGECLRQGEVALFTRLARALCARYWEGLLGKVHIFGPLVDPWVSGHGGGRMWAGGGGKKAGLTYVSSSGGSNYDHRSNCQFNPDYHLPPSEDGPEGRPLTGLPQHGGSRPPTKPTGISADAKCVEEESPQPHPHLCVSKKPAPTPCPRPPNQSLCIQFWH